MGASDSRERAILDAIFGSGSPATWYVGLTTTVPNDDGSGFTQPSDGSYARVAVTNNSTNFPAATTTSGRTVKKNGTAITFPNPTGLWGSIVGIGFFTASSGGTPEITQLLDDVITVASGNTPVEIAANELEIECD